MANKKLVIPIIIVLIIGIAAIIGSGRWDWLIWGIVLICPLMHLFGHNHSSHSHSKKDSSNHHH